MAQAKTAAGTGDSKSDDRSYEDVSAQIEALKADIAGLTQAIGQLGVAKTQEARAYAEGKAGEAKAKAQQGADYLRGQAEDAYGQANEFIQEKPAAALGIAAGLGFVIGTLLARK